MRCIILDLYIFMDYTTIIILIIIAVVGFWYYFRGRNMEPKFFKGSVLDQFTKDLTKMAREGILDPVIGRQEEITRVIRTLSRRTKDNIVLVGKAGVGKTAIVEGLAHAIVQKKVPPALYNKRVMSLDLNALVAGTKYRGEFEERIIRVMDEIRASKRNIILFVDEVHSIAQIGEATGAISAGDILKPALARGDLQMIGATTPVDYEKYVKQDPTLERRLQPMLVSEPTAGETLEILKGIRKKYESHHGVGISDEALKAAIDLSAEYLPSRSYPDKAIDLMDEAASKVKLASIGNGELGHKKPLVAAKDVEEVARQCKSDWCAS